MVELDGLDAVVLPQAVFEGVAVVACVIVGQAVEGQGGVEGGVVGEFRVVFDEVFDQDGGEGRWRIGRFRGSDPDQ